MLVPRVIRLARELVHQEEGHEELHQDAQVEVKERVDEEGEYEKSLEAIIEHYLHLLEDGQIIEVSELFRIIAILAALGQKHRLSIHSEGHRFEGLPRHLVLQMCLLREEHVQSLNRNGGVHGRRCFLLLNRLLQ